MTWEPAPTDEHGRQRDYAAITLSGRLTVKVLFCTAFKQTAGFAESPLQLIGLDWAVPTSAR